METLINIQFNYKGKDYEFVLDLSKFEGKSDFWHTLYGIDANGNNISFDLNYDEEYNTIAIYPIDMNTLDTDHETTIHKQPIFTQEEYMEKYPNFKIGSFPLDFKEPFIRCTLNVIKFHCTWEKFCKITGENTNLLNVKDTDIFEIKRSHAMELGIIK